MEIDERTWLKLIGKIAYCICPSVVRGVVRLAKIDSSKKNKTRHAV